MRGGAEARRPVAGEDLQSWPATLCRGFCLCGRFAIRFQPVAVQALGRLGLLQLVELVERPRGQFAVVSGAGEDLVAVVPDELVGLLLGDARPVALLVGAHERVRPRIPSAHLAFLRDVRFGETVAGELDRLV